MKTRLTCSILLLMSLQSYAQKYGNIWQFGPHAGIDFNTCAPVDLLNGKNGGYEGTATICDTSGQVLFYTNSDTVWNRQDIPMPNGHLIQAGGTLSQVSIIPIPLSDSLYYITTTKVQAGGFLTLQYHVIDMTLDGGLGDVMSKNNVLSTLNVTEQLATTHAANDTDIWLMTHEYGTNNFLAYLVTSTGISLTPVVSSVGPAHKPCLSNINARGTIAFSPDGSKVAFNANGIGPGNGGGNTDSTNLLALFDFDNNTGVVSNPINLPFGRGDFGLSFSPDNSKLYGGTWKAFNFTLNDSNLLYQFDISSADSLTIVNSKKIIFSGAVNAPFGTLKIGPDGKIYVARYKDYLGVINSPNEIGTVCNYVHNGFYLGGAFSDYGLNNYIEYKNYCKNTDISIVNSQTEELIIYPNVATASLNIVYNIHQTATLTITNTYGSLVKQLTLYPYFKNRIVYVDDLAAGVYLVTLREGERIVSKKVVIAR